jgi:predicted phosphodiesterase
LRYCVFSDVHGNYINLVDMFRSIGDLQIDEFICLGDLCNYYPDNKAVIEFMIENNIQCILGNHDLLYISEHNLSAERLESYNYDSELKSSIPYLNFFKNLPTHIILKGEITVLFCHGSPQDFTNEYIYPNTDLEKFTHNPFDIVFSGHTHRQFLRTHNSKIFCNVGSLGMPRDNGLLPGFVVYDSTRQEITLYRKHAKKEVLLARYQNLVPRDVLNLLQRAEPIDFPYRYIE